MVVGVELLPVDYLSLQVGVELAACKPKTSNYRYFLLLCFELTLSTPLLPATGNLHGYSGNRHNYP